MNLPASIPIFSYANNLAVEFYRIRPHVESLVTCFLEFTVVMSDAAHQAGVKEVKYSGGEGELSELETDPRPLQSLLGRHALNDLPGAGLGGVVLFVGLGEMTVDVTLQHGLQPRTIIIPAWRHCLC